MTLPSDTPAWSVPFAVESLPETGRRANLSADESVRKAVAAAAGLREVSQLSAHFELQPLGRAGVKVTGVVEATVVQTCVVTLEPLTNTVREAVEVALLPEAEVQKAIEKAEAAEDVDFEPPETLDGPTIDLGALAVEFLVLGLDPYPRKPDAAFDAPVVEDGRPSPFAALAALKRGD